MATIIIIIFSVFYFFITLGFLLGWHSLRDKNIIGGIIVLWVALLIFFAIIFFVARNHAAPNPTAMILKNIAADQI